MAASRRTSSGCDHRRFARPYLSAIVPRICRNRAHQKADGKHGCGLEKLCGLVACGKKRVGEIKAPNA
jgi:hypothetical protein